MKVARLARINTPVLMVRAVVRLVLKTHVPRSPLTQEYAVLTGKARACWGDDYRLTDAVDFGSHWVLASGLYFY